jgi:hypothetical protein
MVFSIQAAPFSVGRLIEKKKASELPPNFVMAGTSEEKRRARGNNTFLDRFYGLFPALSFKRSLGCLRNLRDPPSFLSIFHLHRSSWSAMTFDEANTARPYLKILFLLLFLAGVAEQMFCAGCRIEVVAEYIWSIQSRSTYTNYRLEWNLKMWAKKESAFYQFRPVSKVEIRRRRQDGQTEDFVSLKKKWNHSIGECLENSAAQR